MNIYRKTSDERQRSISVLIIGVAILILKQEYNFGCCTKIY